MGIFTKKAPVTERRADPVFNESNLKQREILARQYAHRNVEFQVYLDHAIGEAHIAATYNAKACASIPLKLYRRKAAGGSRGFRGGVPVSGASLKSMRVGGHGRKLASFVASGEDMEEVLDHPMLDLLNRPNPIYAGTGLAHLKWYSLFTGGNAYQYASFQGTTPYMLSHMFSQYVNVIASIENTVDSYTYGRAETVWGNYSPNEVIHYKLHPSPHTPLYGIGSLYGVLPHADLLQDCLIHNITMAKNGMRPDGIWELPEQTDPKQTAKFEKQLKSKMMGVANRWKHLIVTAGTKFTPLMMPEKELMSLPSQEKAADLVWQAFGHTKSMRDSTDTNVASAKTSYNKQFLEGTILPALMNDADQLNETLLPMFGLDPDMYCFAYDNPNVEDAMLISDRAIKQVAGGLMTPNEGRVEIGLEEMAGDENADKLVVIGAPAADPFARLFGGSPPPTPKTEPSAEPEPVEETPLDEPDDEKSFDHEAFVKSIMELEPAHYRPCDHCKGTKAGDESPGPTLNDATKFEGGLQSAFEDILTNAQNEAVRAYANDNVPDLSLFHAQAVEALTTELQPVVELGITNVLESSDGVSTVDVPDSAFDIVPQRALDFLSTHAVTVADDIMGTTGEMAKRAVQVGLENGLSIDEIAGQMEGVSAGRAERIARTEVQTAVQQGKLAGFKGIGVKQTMWVNAPGATAAHQVIASRSPKDIGEPYVKAGETIGNETFDRDIYAPPARPNCRCDLQPVFGGEGEEV